MLKACRLTEIEFIYRYFPRFLSAASAGYFNEQLFLRTLFLSDYFGGSITKEYYLKIRIYLQLASL